MKHGSSRLERCWPGGVEPLRFSNGPKSELKHAIPNRAWQLLPDVWGLIKPRRGILGIGFVLMAINRASGLILPGSTRYLYDDVFISRRVHLLLPIVLIVVGATLIQGCTSFALTQLLSKSSQRMISELRSKVQAHIGRLPVSFYDANKTGALVSRIMNDIEGVRNLIGTGLVEFVGGMMTAGLALVYLLRTSATMTGVVFAVLLIFGIGVNEAFKTIRPIFRARPKINAEVTGRLTESLGGIRVVKGYRAEERERKVFADGGERLLDNVLRTLTATSLMSLSATGLMGLLGAVIMLLGARQVLSGRMSPGTFVSYTAFLGMLIAPVFQIVGIGPLITEALTGLERTREVLNEKKENEFPGRTERLDRISGKVAFENVNFAYEINTPVLHDITFESEPGTVTALVGPSGAGKSTIIGLIASFYVPTSGRILVDAVDLAHVELDSYRTQLGVVLQETFLFDGTIRENVAFARPDATEEEILTACLIARVDEFAEKLEKKYETVVGERGVKLSGGQKQRVSIARALLANPRILILDEATSSIDPESEALIQEGLLHLMRGRTTFVIAHRFSTVRCAQQILMVEAGRIIERGTHESLCAAGGRYYDLYTKGLDASSEGSSEAEKIGAAKSEADLSHSVPLVSPVAAQSSKRGSHWKPFAGRRR
jgi:ABC-type multidrug transport system fused ATPase/permease subunit